MVDASNLGEFCFVVRVFYRGFSRHRRGRRGGVAALVRARHALGYQHVVQSHQLGVGGVLRVKVAVTEKTFGFESENARSK